MITNFYKENESVFYGEAYFHNWAEKLLIIKIIIKTYDLKKLNANSIPNTYIHTLAEPRRVTRGITTTAGSAGMLNLPKKGTYLTLPKPYSLHL